MCIRDRGLAEGRAAGHAEVQAQVDKLAGMWQELAKPFEVLDAENLSILFEKVITKIAAEGK